MPTNVEGQNCAVPAEFLNQESGPGRSPSARLVVPRAAEASGGHTLVTFTLPRMLRVFFMRIRELLSDLARRAYETIHQLMSEAHGPHCFGAY